MSVGILVAHVPPMWRSELWHPMVVHFPIGLLLFGVVLYLLHFPFRASVLQKRLLFSARIALVTGSVAAWVAVVTGEVADSVVGRIVCDPLVLEAHEEFGYAVAFLFSAVTVLDILSTFLKNKRLLLWGRVIIASTLVAGAVLIGYVGHLGAKIVYQQGAAVYQPSEDCSEFER
jgi:uncharacterized membrane protein